ncbi:MAG TPA: hypothetical protein VK137_09325 [Planctomycetaceae bacterium]|nr:hypothetical protein [Planctomycetaceae bacterium]
MSDKQVVNNLSLDESNGATPSERLIGWFFPPNLLLALSCVVAAAVFLPKTTRLLPDLRRSSQYRLKTAQIEITPPPHWVPHDLVEQITKKAGLPDELSLLDADVTQRLAAAFERHPWVKGHVRVQTSVPARVQVDMEYREPAAMVRVSSGAKSGLFPIDADAIVLPSTDFSPAEVAKYPVIENVATTPRGPAGTAWDDVGVLGAARLAVWLKPNWKEFGLKSIRVPARSPSKVAGNELSYQLNTPGGSRIIWGRPPGSRHPGEVPAEKKIERMKYYLRHHGPFDSKHGPCEFDITNWRDISRKPIADKAASTRHRS